MLISKEISSLVKSFHIWILFFFTRHFCFFSLVLLVTFCTQMHSKWKFGWMNQKMLDEKFDREKTSSNIAQHDFCLLFSYKFCKLSNTSNISSNIESLRCWMKPWIHFRWPLDCQDKRIQQCLNAQLLNEMLDEIVNSFKFHQTHHSTFFFHPTWSNMNVQMNPIFHSTPWEFF